MSLKDEIINAVQWLLKELQKEASATSENKHIYFEYQNYENVPEYEDQRRAIKYLEKEKAIKLVKNKYALSVVSPIMAQTFNIKPIGFYLDILQPTFDMVAERITKPKELSFDPSTSILILNGSNILISKSKNSDAHYLLTIISQNFSKDWANDEILESPYLHSKKEKKNNKANGQKIFQAGYSVNEIIEKATSVKGFLRLSMTSISIEKKYLS